MSIPEQQEQPESSSASPSRLHTRSDVSVNDLLTNDASGANATIGFSSPDEEPGRRDGSGTVKEKSPGNRPGSEFSLRTFPTVRRKNSSSKYNVRVASLMLWRLPTGDPLDLDKN